MADMTTRTWENAAYAAAESVIEITDDGLQTNFGQPRLDEIEKFLGDLRDGFASRCTWEYIADNALQEFAAIETPFFGVSREGLLEDVVDTIISKQHDYGHDNILWGGVEGIVLRMHDKTARIRNLQERGAGIRAESFVPLNESLADSWLDLVGYALIGIMLRDGTFNLPLARDLDRVEYVNAILDDDEQDWNDVEATPPDADCFTLPNGECIAEPCSLHDDQPYDEATDPTLWGMFTDSQHVFVGTYLYGFKDGLPKAAIFAKGKGSSDDATGAYFNADELFTLIAYLMDVHEVLVATQVVDARPHVVVAP